MSDHDEETVLLKKCEAYNIRVPQCVIICSNKVIKVEALKLLISRQADKNNIIRQCAKDNEQNNNKILHDMKLELGNQWDEFMSTNPPI